MLINEAYLVLWCTLLSQILIRFACFKAREISGFELIGIHLVLLDERILLIERMSVDMLTNSMLIRTRMASLFSFAKAFDENLVILSGQYWKIKRQQNSLIFHRLLTPNYWISRRVWQHNRSSFDTLTWTFRQLSFQISVKRKDHVVILIAFQLTTS